VSSQAVPQPGALVDEEQVCELLLIRHGRSADVVPGSDESLDPPLHDLGHRQAEALARRLDGKDIAAIYASDLARAVQTAGYLSMSRDVEVQQRQDLREVWLGEWERGEFRRRAQTRDPEWLAFARSGRWDLVPGSEGDDALRTRVERAIGEIAAHHRGETVAVVVHGGVINAYLAATFETTSSWFALIENTSVTVVLAGAERRILVTVNDCTHLYDPVVQRPAP
jgi:2,3-bisphosphoglycerate-dependent phosphoglycerate mutase